MKEFKQAKISEKEFRPETGAVIDSFLTNFKGSNRLQRGGGWQLAGGGNNTSTFLANSVAYSLVPASSGAYSLGSSGSKWADIYALKINGVTPKSGSATYYVATSSGGGVTTAITFNTGILT